MRDGEVLIVIDGQNGFCPDDRLAVPEGAELVPAADRRTPLFRHVVLMRDRQPDGRLSFASRHSAEDATAHGFDTIGVEEAWRATDLPGSAAATKTSFRDRGIELT